MDAELALIVGNNSIEVYGSFSLDTGLAIAVLWIFPFRTKDVLFLSDIHQSFVAE